MRLPVVIILWAVTAWRLPSARHEPWKRALWLAFAALATALTLDLPPVIKAVDQGTGVVDLATLLKHLTGIVACAAVLDWVIALTRPETLRRRPAWRHAVAAVAMLALSVLFCFIRRRESADFASSMAGDPTATAYLIVFEAYLTIAMGMASAMFVMAARQAAAGLLRWGLWLMAAGAALGVAYAIIRSAFLLIQLAGGSVPGGNSRGIAATDLLQESAILLIVAGSSLPAVTIVLRAARDYRALQALRPLWAELTASAPQVVLGTPPSRRDDLTATRAVRVRLLRRTVEIRDAALLLRGYLSDSDTERIRAELAARGLAGEELSVAAEAAWLRASLHTKARHLPAHPISSPDPLYDSEDFPGEVRWLRRIAGAYHGPAVMAAAEQITASRLAGEPK